MHSAPPPPCLASPPSSPPPPCATISASFTSPCGSISARSKLANSPDTPPPPAPPPQVGSLLELWTGGACKAAVHRVVNRSGCERYSTALFRGNALDTVCRPLLAPGDACGGQGGEASSLVPASMLDSYRPVRVRSYLGTFASAFKPAPGSDADASGSRAAVQSSPAA